MESNKDPKSDRTPKGNVFRNEERPAKSDSERLEPKPEVPRKDSAFMKGLKKVGYSVWLIVMIVGGGLAFITFLFLV